MNLNYLIDPNMQFQDRNGVNNVAGFLRVYYEGSDDRATTYKDFIGTLNRADIPLDNDGRAVVIADSDKEYRVEVYSASGAMLWTQHPVFPQGGGGSEYDGDVSDATATFTKDDGDTSEMSSGSTLKVLFTKISKFFAGLKRVAFTGSYNDLEDTPTIPAAQVQSDWNEANNTKADYIKNKPSLASVATSGNYADLSNKPTIPASPVQSDWDESDISSLAYIQNKPDIPAEQIQSDWSQTDNTKKDFIKNKPTIPDDNIFVAEFGTTTYTKVYEEAVTNAKAVFCRWGKLVVPLRRFSSGIFHFGGIVFSGGNYDNITLDSSNNWFNTPRNIEEDCVFKKSFTTSNPAHAAITAADISNGYIDIDLDLGSEFLSYFGNIVVFIGIPNRSFAGNLNKAFTRIELYTISDDSNHYLAAKIKDTSKDDYGDALDPNDNVYTWNRIYSGTSTRVLALSGFKARCYLSSGTEWVVNLGVNFYIHFTILL